MDVILSVCAGEGADGFLSTSDRLPPTFRYLSVPLRPLRSAELPCAFDEVPFRRCKGRSRKAARPLESHAQVDGRKGRGEDYDRQSRRLQIQGARRGMISDNCARRRIQADNGSGADAATQSRQRRSHARLATCLESPGDREPDTGAERALFKQNKPAHAHRTRHRQSAQGSGNRDRAHAAFFGSFGGEIREVRGTG